MQNVYQTYLENEILTANPLELVQLLYRGALNAIAAARQHLAAGRIVERSQAIGKALAILHHLGRSLDHEKGGNISRQLAALYDYIGRLLIQANAKQTEAPLIEAERLLTTLGEAWDQVLPAPEASAQYSAPQEMRAEYRSFSYAY